MGKLSFYLETCVSSIIYYFYKFFNKGFNLKRLPFHFYNAGKIYDWQNREDKFSYDWTHMNRFNCFDPSSQLIELQTINNLVSVGIEYVKDVVNYDKKEHWAITKEILKRESGGCEDQAFVKYRYMFESGFPRNKIGIVCVKGHAFAVYHFKEDDLYVLDNGFLSYSVIKASELFKEGDYLRPIVGFNVGSQWSY